MKGAIHSGIRSLNNCEIDVASGARNGVRVTFEDYKVIVDVKDSDDVSYRECSQQLIMNKSWQSYKFAMAAKNSNDERGKMQITDVDIDSVKISVLDALYMYSLEEQEAERNEFLLQRHEVKDGDGMAEEADLARIFELNIAHKMAAEQRKNLAFLEDDDSDEEMLFKHYETLKRYRFNINQFNDQIQLAIRDEDDSMSHLLSSTHLQGTQALLEDVYKGSEDMSKNLKELMDMTRSTIEGIANNAAGPD